MAGQYMDPNQFPTQPYVTTRAQGPGGGGGFPGGGIPSFASLLPQLLMSFGPALLNKIFGKDPAKEFHKKVAQLTSAQNVGKLTNQFYQQNLGSPAYSQAQGTIAAGANAGAGQLAANLGRMGISDTGTGAVLSSLTPSIVGSQQAGLRTSAYGAGQQQANQSIQAQLNALGATQGQPSPTQGFVGAGLESFGPVFQNFLRSKYPQLFAQYGG